MPRARARRADRGPRPQPAPAALGRPEHGRHRSLRNAIEWSFRLLSAPDRTLLNTVSVFASWFDVDAAHAPSAGAGADAGADRFDVADALARLADNSLLLVAAGEPTRYRALETIRQFAAEQLAELGHSDAVHDSHGHWCRAQLAALAQQPRDDAWCDRLDRIAADASGRPGVGRGASRRPECRSSLQSSWPSNCSCAADRKNRSAATSVLPRCRAATPIVPAFFASRRARQPAASSATTRCACCARPPPARLQPTIRAPPPRIWPGW